MPTAIMEKVHLGFNRLNESLQERPLAYCPVHQGLVEAMTDLADSLREYEGNLRQAVRMGVEKNELAEVVGPQSIPAVEMALESLHRARDRYPEEVEIASLANSQITETEQFIVWLRALVAILSRPVKKVEEPKLPPVDASTRFMTVPQAREAIRKGKSKS